MTKDKIGKFTEGERTSVRRGSENFGRMREEKSGCEINTREEEIAVGESIAGGRARVGESSMTKTREIRSGGEKEKMNGD